MGRYRYNDRYPHTVYVIRDESGTVVYVGCTRYLEERIAQHRRKSWWSDGLTVEAKRYRDKATGTDAELALIHEHDPIHNFQGTERSRDLARRNAGKRWPSRQGAVDA